MDSLNNFFNIQSVLLSLSKANNDFKTVNNELMLLYEEHLELALLQAFEDVFEAVLDKINLLDEFVKKHLTNDLLVDLIKCPLEPRYKYVQVGITRFVTHTFSVEINEWLEKSGINETIKNISIVNPDPFAKPIKNAQLKAHVAGGQTVFSTFDVKVDFALRDKNVEKLYEEYAIKLSEQVASQLQNKIKFEILEGLKTAESIPKIRNRILNTYNKPLDIVVKPKLNDKGEIIRQGYQYQMSPKHWATTVARTEVMAGYTKGRLEGFKQGGVVDRVEYSVSADERLCDICAPFDGKIYKLSDANGVIPQHPNCRCQWIPLVSEGSVDNAKTKFQENVAKEYATPNPVKTKIPKEIAEPKKKIPKKAKSKINTDEQQFGKFGNGKNDIVDNFKKYYEEENGVKLTQSDGEKIDEYVERMFGKKKIYKEDLEKAFDIDSNKYTVVLNDDVINSNFQELIEGDKIVNDFFIDGEIFPKKKGDGEYSVGEFSRIFNWNAETKKRTVTHENFQLVESAQGLGIGKSMLKNSIDFYDYIGIDEINLLADNEVGKYAWAKYGFDFENIDVKYYRQMYVDSLKTIYEDKFSAVDIEFEDIEKAWKTAEKSIKKRLGEFKHSWDYALADEIFIIGDKSIRVTGKEIIFGGDLDWSGVLKLDKDGIGRKMMDNYLTGNNQAPNAFTHPIKVSTKGSGTPIKSKPDKYTKLIDDAVYDLITNFGYEDGETFEDLCRMINVRPKESLKKIQVLVSSKVDELVKAGKVDGVSLDMFESFAIEFTESSNNDGSSILKYIAERANGSKTIYDRGEFIGTDESLRKKFLSRIDKIFSDENFIEKISYDFNIPKKSINKEFIVEKLVDAYEFNSKLNKALIREIQNLNRGKHFSKFTLYRGVENDYFAASGIDDKTLATVFDKKVNIGVNNVDSWTLSEEKADHFSNFGYVFEMNIADNDFIDFDIPISSLTSYLMADFGELEFTIFSHKNMINAILRNKKIK